MGAEVAFTSGSFSATQLTDDHGELCIFPGFSGAGSAQKISAPGFQVRTLRLADRLPADHSAARNAAEQVTVAANRTGVRVIENATSVTILSAQDLRATAAFRTDDILRQVPGFSLFRRTTSRTANPTAQGVSLRGLGASGASRALVLSDGFPLTISFGTLVHIPMLVFKGKPSLSTRARLAPLAPRPRRETPCAVGLAVRLVVRRNRLNPGTWRRMSSVRNAAVAPRSWADRIVTLVAFSMTRTPVRLAATVTCSAAVAGSRVICRCLAVPVESPDLKSGRGNLERSRLR